MPQALAWTLIALSVIVNVWGVYWVVKLGW